MYGKWEGLSKLFCERTRSGAFSATRYLAFNVIADVARAVPLKDAEAVRRVMG